MSSEAGGVKPLKQFHRLRQTTTPQEQDQKLRNVAEMYEKAFLKEMLKSMRGTVQDSGLINVNQAEKIFKEELDTEYVDQWAKKGGVGFSKIIYDQLIEKFGAQLGIKPAEEKPRGPIMLDEKSKFIGQVRKQSEAPNKLSYTFSFSQMAGPESLQEPELLKIQSPWDGKISSNQILGLDQSLLEITHDNGLKSSFVYKGKPVPGLSLGQVQAGETVGILSPEAKNLYWTVLSGQAE